MLIHQYMKRLRYFRSLPPLDTLFDNPPTAVPDLQHEYDYWLMYRHIPTRDVNFLFNVNTHIPKKGFYWQIIRKFLHQYCGSTLLRSQRFIANLPEEIFKFSYMVEWRQHVRLPFGRIPIIGRYIALLDSFTIEVPDLNLAVTFPQHVDMALHALQQVLHDQYSLLQEKRTLGGLSSEEQEYLLVLSSYIQNRKPSTCPEDVRIYHLPKEILILPFKELQYYGVYYPLLPYRYIPVAPFSLLFNHDFTRQWWYEVYKKHPNLYVKRIIALLLLSDQGIIGPTLMRFKTIRSLYQAGFISAVLFPFVRTRSTPKHLQKAYEKHRYPKYVLEPSTVLRQIEDFVEYVHTFDFNKKVYSYVFCAKKLFSNPYGFLENPREIFTNSKRRVILLPDSEPIKQEFRVFFETRNVPKFHGNLPPRREVNIMLKGGLI